MLRTFLIALFVVLLLWASPFLSQQHASVTFTIGDTTYTLTLFTFILAAIIGLVVLYLAEAFVRLIFRFLFGWITNRKERLAKKSQERNTEGMRNLIAGNYSKAQKLLDKSVKHAPDACLNLLQTFEAALRNNDLIGAENALNQAIKVATEDDRDLLDVCKLKFYVAKEQWKKATRALHDVLYRVNTEEVNLQALKIYKATKAFGRLEDLLPALRKKGWISEEQYNAEVRWLENGVIDEHYQEPSKSKELLEWFYSQPNFRRYGCASRNILLAKLLEAEQWEDAIQIAWDSLELVPLKELEQSEFFDLLLKIKTDSIDKKLVRRLERKFNKFSPETKLKVQHVLTDLYFLQGDYLKAQHWIEALLESEDKEGIPHSPQSLLLAQVVYRRLGSENKLQAITQAVDKQYLIGGFETVDTSDEAVADPTPTTEPNPATADEATADATNQSLEKNVEATIVKPR